MGLPHSQVVRVTASCVSRTVKIPLFQPVKKEPKRAPQPVNDSKIPKGVAPIATAPTVDKAPQMSQLDLSAARAFIETLKPQGAEEVKYKFAKTKVVLPQ